MKNVISLVSLLTLTQSICPTVQSPAKNMAELDVVIAAITNKNYEAFFQGYSKLSDAQKVQALNNFFLMINPDQVSRICIQSLCRAIKVLHDKDDLKATLIKQLLIPATWKKALIEENQAISKLFEASQEADVKVKAVPEEDDSYLSQVLKVAAQVPLSYPGVSRADIEDAFPKIQLPISNDVPDGGTITAEDTAMDIAAMKVWHSTTQLLRDRSIGYSDHHRIAWCLLARQGIHMLAISCADVPKNKAIERFLEVVPRVYKKEVERFTKPHFPIGTNYSGPQPLGASSWYFDYPAVLEHYRQRRSQICGLVLGSMGTNKNLAGIIAAYEVPFGQSIGQAQEVERKHAIGQAQEVERKHARARESFGLQNRLLNTLDGLASDQVVDLSHNLIAELESDNSLQRLAEVKKLNLGHNNLLRLDGKFLPSELVELDAHHNAIRTVDFSACKNMYKLGLSYNQIADLPEGSLPPRGCRSIHLSGNPLTRVPPDIYKMTGKLLYLSLSRCALPPEEITALKEWWALNPQREMCHLACDDQQESSEADRKHAIANAHANDAAK